MREQRKAAAILAIPAPLLREGNPAVTSRQQGAKLLNLKFGEHPRAQAVLCEAIPYNPETGRNTAFMLIFSISIRQPIVEECLYERDGGDHGAGSKRWSSTKIDKTTPRRK